MNQCADYTRSWLFYRRRTARRAVSAEIWLTVGRSCTTNLEQIDVMESEVRPTCNKLCASGDDASTVTCVIHKPDRRPVLLTTPSTCCGEVESLEQSSREKFPHFYRAMLFIRGTSHGPVSVFVSLSVCLFVSVSVTSRSSAKTAKRRITQTTPHDTPGILVF